MAKANRRHWCPGLLVCWTPVALAMACSDKTDPGDNNAADAGSGSETTRARGDAGTTGADAGAPDSRDDAGTPNRGSDSGSPGDAETETDAGTKTDSGSADAGPDQARDSGPEGDPDAGSQPDLDAGPASDSSSDAAPDGGEDARPDAADTDAGAVDAGDLDADPRDAADVDIDARAEPDAAVAGDCEDNDGLPDVYPVLYRESQDARDRFETEKARLLAAYGLDEGAYAITAAPITSVASLDSGGNIRLLLDSGTIDETTTTRIATDFLSEWGKLFGYEGTTTSTNEPSCVSKFCHVTFTQALCGMPVFSREPDYGGSTTVQLHIEVQGIYRLTSHFVPVVSLPRNALISEQDAAAAVVGQTLTHQCADGEHSVQVTDQDEITVLETKTVYVRTSPNVESALEYRVALPVQVGAAPGWTIYVDGIDGTVLDSVASFICD